MFTALFEGALFLVCIRYFVRKKFMKSTPKHRADQVIGKFSLTTFLGMGGFGEVWLAEHLELSGRKEVIKFANDAQCLEILRDEGSTLQELNHPGIVRVTDMDTTGANPYLRMEYIDSPTLEEKLKKEGKIPWPIALEMIWKIAEIIDYAHSQQILHGDLKPSNIFLTPTQIKVADFGLATYHLRTQSEVELSGCLKSAVGEIAGTWNYMSPEQKQGKLNKKSDVYALGIILFRMITGSLPSGLETPSQLVPECPVLVDTLVADMLAPTDKRLRNMTEVKNAVQQTLKIVNAKPSNIWKMISFIIGVCLIIFAVGFLTRLRSMWALLIVCASGFWFLENARPKLPQFWPLLLFWLGIGLCVVSWINRLSYVSWLPLAVGLAGGLWFILSPESSETKK